MGDAKVRYICRHNGDAYGDAVRTGLKSARGKYIVFMDADGSHAPEFIVRLMEYRDDFDVVIASRYVKGGATDNPRVLILMSRLINVIYSLVLNLDCKDVSNSFKLYRSQYLKELVLRCNDFDIIEEILFKLKRTRKNLRVKEHPCTFKKRMFGAAPNATLLRLWHLMR